MDTINVLYVEDDEDDYVIVRDLLSECGQIKYQLAWVNKGEEALAELTAPGGLYDVCLLDYRLGSQTGLDIMAQAVQAGVTTPMILLTEHSDRQIDLSAMQAGASDFLVKSEINSINLDRVIRYVCAVNRQDQERLKLALAEEERRLAEEAVKAKDEFLAMVSHEMRGPINAILLWTELLKSADADEATAKTAIETIERSVQQQGKILDDLVEFTRSRNQMIKLYKQSVNLAELVGHAVSIQMPVAAAKSVLLTFDSEADTLVAEADPDRLLQIFNNLLTNALKFTSAHGEIQVKVKADAESMAEVSIADTGIGINAEMMPFIFDRYQQAPTHSYSSNTGLGLGLTLARQLVEQHGGSIRAESAGKDRGATFFVNLPLNR